MPIEVVVTAPATATAGANRDTDSSPATPLSRLNFKRFINVEDLELPDIGSRILAIG
jgi:hypothetical protein